MQRPLNAFKCRPYLPLWATMSHYVIMPPPWIFGAPGNCAMHLKAAQLSIYRRTWAQKATARHDDSTIDQYSIVRVHGNDCNLQLLKNVSSQIETTEKMCLCKLQLLKNVSIQIATIEKCVYTNCNHRKLSMQIASISEKLSMQIASISEQLSMQIASIIEQLSMQIASIIHLKKCVSLQIAIITYDVHVLVMP